MVCVKTLYGRNDDDDDDDDNGGGDDDDCDDADVYLDQFVFTHVFPSNLVNFVLLVGSPRELYLKVHKDRINLTCMFFYCISKYLFHIL